MPAMKRKTEKAISKHMKKLVKEHGPEIALGLATTLIGTVVGAATAKASAKPKKKSVAAKKTDKPKIRLKAEGIKEKLAKTPKKEKKQPATGRRV